MPSEHGGWGLTGEPILLGLLLAFSWAGIAIGAAAMLAFLARTPLKLAAVDRRRGRSLPRTLLARRIAAAELLAIGLLGAGAVAGAGWRWLVPVAAAVPLAGVELWFDVRSRGRRLVPELAGAVGMGAVASAIVIAGDGRSSLAMAAWLLLAARSVAAVPFIRAQIARLRHGEADTGACDLFQLGGVVVALAAVAVEPDTVAGAAMVVVVAGLHLRWIRRSPVPAAKVLGLRQMALGTALVVVTAVGVWLA